MFKIKSFSVALAMSCLFVVLIGFTQGCKKTTKVSLPLSGEKGLEPDPRLIKGSLANGFTYILLKNSKPENRVSMHLDIDAGSMNETEGERGVAHFLEHMLFNGSTHFKPDDLVEYFQSIGMRFGSDANAHTGFFETVYDVFIPAGDKEAIDKGLLVLDDFARGALLLESEVERERGVILSEKRERDTVSYRTFNATLGFELPGSRIPRRFPIGTEEIISKADRALLKGFYDTWYRPDRMALVMVGDFDVPVVEALIRERFSGMTARAEKKSSPKDSFKGHDRDRAFYHFEPEAGNTTITIEAIRAVPFEADTLLKFKERSARSLAEAIVENRLAKIVREKDSPISDAGIYSGDFLQGVHFSVITAECRPDKWDKTLGLLEKNLRSALKFGFSKQELTRVKADFIQELMTGVKEASTRKSDDLALEIIRETNNKGVFQSPQQKLDILKPYIESLTLDDVTRIFRQTWATDPRVVLVTGNAVIGSLGTASVEDVILNTFSLSRAEEVLPLKDNKLVLFPYLPEPETAGHIRQSKTIEDLGISVFEFDNRVKLSLKPTEYKKGEFIFKIGFGQGIKGEPENMPGVALLGAGVINGSGFGAIDKDELEEALAGRNVHFDFVADQGSFFIQGSAAPEEAELLFQIVRTYLLDPGFRKDALDLAKERYRKMYQELLGTPEGVMELKGTRFLANNDSRFGLPLLSSVEKLTLEDIKSWMLPFFDHGEVEVSVVGDFDQNNVVNLAGKYLGTLPERGGIMVQDLRQDPAFPVGKNLNLTVDTVLDKALVQVSFLTDDFWDVGQTRRLNIVADIFSERLRKNVREKIGASYSPYAYNDPSNEYDGYGIMRAVVNVDPGAANLVVKEIQDIATSLMEKGVSQKELDLAKKPILTHIRDMRTNNSYWLESVLSGSGDHPEKFSWARSILHDYESITIAGVNALTHKYFNIKKGALIVISPLP